MKSTMNESVQYLNELLSILEEGTTHHEYDIDMFVDDVRKHSWVVKDQESLINFQVALIKFIKLDDYFNDVAHIIIIAELFDWAKEYFWV